MRSSIVPRIFHALPFDLEKDVLLTEYFCYYSVYHNLRVFYLDEVSFWTSTDTAGLVSAGDEIHSLSLDDFQRFRSRYEKFVHMRAKEKR